MKQRRTRFTAPQPDDRRLGYIPGRRFALVAAVCAGLLACVAPGALADDSSPVVQATVYGSGSQTTTASVSPAYLLANAQQCPAYSGGSLDEHGRQGVVTVTPSPTRSWTLSTILGCLSPQPISPSRVTSITVIGDTGSPLENPGSQITSADLGSSIDPVVQALGSTDQYDRPWRGGSDLDYLDETQTTPIAIEIFEGAPLQVSASASQTTVTAGSTIGFNAAVSGGSGPFTYNWSFDGGAANSSQAAPQVQFSSPGVWTVQVQVISADGGTGGAQLTVTVNQPGTTSAPTTTGKTTTGPTKSKGPTPKGNPSQQRKSGAAGTSKGNGNGNQTSTTQTTTTQTSTTQTTTTQSTTTPAAGGSGGSSAGSSGNGSSTPTTTAQTHPAKAHPKAPTHRASPTPPPTTGTLVTGELISDVVPLPADRSPLVHLVSAASGSAPAREAPEGPSMWPIAAGVLAILALLALGAQRELGRPRWWRVLHIGG